MVKKRGGRRGKASNAPEAQPSDPEAGGEPRPSTSQTQKQLAVQPIQKAETSADTKGRDYPKQPPVMQEDPPWPRPSQDQRGVQPIQKAETSKSSGDATHLPEESASQIQEPRSVQPIQEQSAWSTQKPSEHRGRGRPMSEAQSGGRGRGTYQPRPMGEGQPHGRGRGRGQPRPPGFERKETPLMGPSGASQVWGGARPKEKDQKAETRKNEALAQSGSLSEIEALLPFQPGTSGRKIQIETNHLRLNLGSLKTVYRYAVKIEPEKKPKRMYREAFQLFQKAYFPENNPSYDGQSLLYSAKQLPFGDSVDGKVTINTDRSTQEFTIALKLTGTLDLSPLRNLLQKKNIGEEEAFQCLEVVLRQAYVNSFINVGRRFYTSTGNEYPLGAGAVMYLGGFQSAVKGWIPFLNMDVAHKAFTSSTSIPDLIVQMFSTKNRPMSLNDLQKPLPRWQMDQLNEYLKSLKVVYTIPTVPNSKRDYKINGLGLSSNAEKFENDGRVITVEEYFKKKWHCNLRFVNLPTLWVGNIDKRICIPMEYCMLKAGQPLQGTQLIRTQTSQMISYSATSTSERKKKIQNVMRTADHNNNACIEEFGFSVGSNFEIVPARVLNRPELEYSKGTVVPEVDGTWRAKTFKKGAEIKKWTIVGFGIYENMKDKLYELGKMVSDFGNSSGMLFSKPEEPFNILRNDKTSLIQFLTSKKNFDLIIVVFSGNLKDLYYLIKQEAEQNIGILTQCVMSDTLYKLNKTTVTNILLKINCKMNGTNHALSNFALISKEPCMVMGADVTHPSPQAKTIPSVVAVTASYDLTATNYSTSVYLQLPRNAMSEIIQNLADITLEKIKLMVEKSGHEPGRIYFFRDGVSDGEFQRVKEVEVKAIKNACEMYRKGYNPKVAFIVVQKRHHTRFFPTDGNSSAGDRYDNVPVGTVVDRVIVDPTIRSFFLMSHQSIKGVGRPTKYCVLLDENGMDGDDVEILAYYLCYLYTRCNRSVSYPAPTYFAHLAADRGKAYLYKKNVDLQNLDQRLVKINRGFVERNPMFFS